jgi:hypothetical protein
LLGRPFKNVWIIRPGKSRILNPNDIHVRLAPQRAAKVDVPPTPRLAITILERMFHR